MSRHVYHMLVCDGPKCSRQFGGPNAGDYGTLQPGDSQDALFENLETEALDLGWLSATRYTDTGYFHSAKCLTAWLRQSRTG